MTKTWIGLRNLQNGLVRDKTASDWPASIAATGLSLAVYPVAVERGFIARADVALEGGVRADKLTVTVLPDLAAPLLGMDVLGRLHFSQKPGELRNEPHP